MKTHLLSCSLLIISSLVYGQGCIPIRNIVGFGQFMNPEYDAINGTPTNWLINVNSRYLKIARSYAGSSRTNIPHEDERLNETFIMNFGITRMLANGWSLTLDVPLAANSRTTWQEHDPTDPNKVHHSVHSFGLGDIRVTAYKWILNPSVTHRANVQLGLSLKLPTGDYRYQDYFYKASGKIIAPVNSTIQLGDGGTGISTELNAFYTLNKTISLYANGFYLFNPRDQNGVSSIDGGGTATPIQIETGDFVNSVPDAYTARFGANFTVKNFIFWTGARIEGQPTYDVIGKSSGTRRAGQVISLEPGINYKVKNTIIYLFVATPVKRKIQQTVADKERSEILGQYSISPGGFADYLIFVGALFKI